MGEQVAVKSLEAIGGKEVEPPLIVVS